MHKRNWIFTLSSINVLLVTIERFSPTTKIIFNPYHFIRLHELLQISTLILFTVLLPVLLLKEVTKNFEMLNSGKGLALLVVFITGIYFYATGNGLHEVSSFTLNNFCDVKNLSGDLCHGLYINDYYTGNILYFIGGSMMILPLLLFEKHNPSQVFDTKQMTILICNAILYAFAIFAYAAFDPVLVGMTYSLIMTIVSGFIFWGIRKIYRQYPVITYTMLTYLLGTVAAMLVRFH